MFIIHKFHDNSMGLSDLHDDNFIALDEDTSAEQMKIVLDAAISLTNKEVAKRIREVFGDTPHGEEFAQLVEQGSVIPNAKIYLVGNGWEVAAAEGNKAAAKEIADKLVGAGEQ